MPADSYLKISCKSSCSKSEESELVRLMFGLAIVLKACHCVTQSLVNV